MGDRYTQIKADLTATYFILREAAGRLIERTTRLGAIEQQSEQLVHQSHTFLENAKPPMWRRVLIYFIFLISWLWDKSLVAFHTVKVYAFIFYRDYVRGRPLIEHDDRQELGVSGRNGEKQRKHPAVREVS